VISATSASGPSYRVEIRASQDPSCDQPDKRLVADFEARPNLKPRPPVVRRTPSVPSMRLARGAGTRGEWRPATRMSSSIPSHCFPIAEGFRHRQGALEGPEW